MSYKGFINSDLSLNRTNISGYNSAPDILLNTNDHTDIVRLLNYVCLNRYLPKSPAEALAVETFKYARDFILRNSIDKITFDWDNTLYSSLVIQGANVFPAKLFKNKPPKYFCNKLLTAIEAPRPFMEELVLGMMVGFAIKQNLTLFTEWENYKPQLAIVTLTWPERLAELAKTYVPLLSVIEGCFPGTVNLSEKILTNKGILSESPGKCLPLSPD
ncbi:hypothetical protein TUM19329_24080 [Legionella antarctica]|uniref:Uncharacterized protein n=1 Tax=Legionella antarctica TaxID=2708020 RepID=A0A6F8T7B6_9GAMM|nr:hypothetical protein [Legionella antarctica]BCA96047.1 hypothetical protein TUM19329_24080 [Legionella antarctica]